ncbi:MAG: hypothetical protein EHM41_03130 [Chloroflexi bacterium]|nr:MAG: hypothetical protein EHM41_03130 [Chloroflexota bacterium]
MNDQTKPDSIKTEKPHRKELPRRISFLLRMWCVDETERSNWRASLEMLETSKRIGFASLEQLFIYLIDFSDSHNDVQDKENKE